MIEDKELRDLFKIEAGEHLQRLSDGLLCLEKEPKDNATLEEVFREAHSLKGAARMVGVVDVEIISHKLEDILGAVKKGEMALSPEVVDSMLKALDTIRNLIHEAVTGEAAGVDVTKILDFGLGILDLKPEIEKSKFQNLKSKIDEFQIPKSTIEEFRIETIRVDTKMLDALMTQTGELTVTKAHISSRIPEIDEIIEIAEELEKRSAEFGVRSAELKSKLQNLKSKIGGDSSRLDFISDRIDEGIRKIRMIPLTTIFNLYPKMVRDMTRQQSKDVNLIIEGEDVVADKRIVEEMKDPLMHIIRNSIDHGIEKPEDRERLGKPRTGTIKLKGMQTASNVVIEVSDDGKGLDIEAVKQAAVKRNIYSEAELSGMTKAQIESLIFQSGISTSSFVSDVSGRGVGLDVVRTNVERLKGNITLESFPNAGCRFRIKLPVTVSTMRVLIAAFGGRRYAIPVEYVEMSRMITRDDIFTVAGRQTVKIDSQPISVARLKELLEVRNAEFGMRNEELKLNNPASHSTLRTPHSAFPCIILSVNNERMGLIVDDLIDEQEVILKPQSAILKSVRNVSGATLLATGEVCMVLNPNDMLKALRRQEAPTPPEIPAEKEIKKKTILLVEDSIVTRTQERRILEGAGYKVVIAVDGMDALNKLSSQSFDALVSDIIMPNMDGLTLTEKIRKDTKYKELPVILVTTLSSDEDRKKGMDVGANAYIDKPAFDQKAFLEIVERLI
ncbi:MAG: hybrid sensor histidine kinase/response regulator [Nitrospinae bacterium]|nr:hybrid sensor histidine kinase/response regulator [Nitrospinota bacterium]